MLTCLGDGLRARWGSAVSPDRTGCRVLLNLVRKGARKAYSPLIGLDLHELPGCMMGSILQCS